MITSVRHRAAGLILAADRLLPGFEPGAGDVGEDVRIHLESRPAWHAGAATLVHAGDIIADTARPIVTVSRSRAGFHFSYADGTHVWVAATGTDVWCTWPVTASLADTSTYLCGPILGLLLRLRRALSFHASAVQIGGGAVGFCGPHGAGKSTLAAALAGRGCAVVTDDVLHVRQADARWVAEPFAAMLKLWPDGARLALGNALELPRIVEGWNKRALTPGGRIEAAATALPLLALVCLDGAGTDATIEPMSPAAALVRLAANTSAAHLLDQDLRAAEFRALAELVRAVPCVSVAAVQDPAAFPVFVERVLDWARGLRGAPAG